MRMLVMGASSGVRQLDHTQKPVLLVPARQPDICVVA